jgi:hypothetical protein
VRYIKTFCVTAPAFVLVGRFVPDQPMAWWPDALIFGGFMGALAAFVVMRVTHVRQTIRHSRGLGAAVWSGIQRRRR